MSPPDMDWAAALAEVAPEYGVALDFAARERLGRFLATLSDWNTRIRLVGDAAPEVLLRRHVGESLALAAACRLDGNAVLWDIGSGAGFPGLPLALAYPGLNTTMVESTQKKAGFLQQVIAELGVGGQIRVQNRRLEELKPAEFAPAPDWVTCRALERMETVPRRFAKIFAAGTRVALWVTESQADEWASAPMWEWHARHPLPGSRTRIILVGVPRGSG